MRYGKRLGYFVLCALAAILVELSIYAGTPPRLSTPVQFSLPDQPKAIEDIAIGEDGRLFLLDLENTKILVFSSDLKKMTVLGIPSRGRGALEKPMRLSICGDNIAVAEHDHISIYSGKSGSLEKEVPNLELYAPFLGFALLPSHIIFTGFGFEAARPTKGASVTFLKHFSTDLQGQSLHIVRKEEVPVHSLGSWQVFSEGWQTNWNGNWVVARSLPLTLTLFNKDAEVVGQSKWSEGQLPQADAQTISNPGAFKELLYSTPHAVGLIPLKKWLGVLWWTSSPTRDQFKIIWVDEKLQKVGETPLPFPIRLGSSDYIHSIAVTGDLRVLLLVVHRSAFGLGTSELFVSTAELQP